MRLKPTEVIAGVLLAAALLVGAWVHCGCESDGCEPGGNRCRRDNVETCNGDGDWYVSDHCATYGEEWTCCLAEDADGLFYACEPAAVCDGGTP